LQSKGNQMTNANKEIGPESLLTLIDGSGYIFRAFFGIPKLNRKSDGLPVNAVSGFCNMLFKFLADGKKAEDQPTHLAVIFDASSQTFRNEIYPQYKAQRPPAPEDLVPQFPLIRQATMAFGVPSIEMIGYEADDLIATYAKIAVEKGARVRIVSSDKDLMQLMSDKIAIYDPMKDIPLGLEDVQKKFGVTPDKVIDIQALAGDSSDNVPGAPGIGVKTAAELINQFGTLEELLDRAGEIKQPKRRETLINFREQIEISKRLVTLMDNVPNIIPPEEFRVREPDARELIEFLDSMEFSTLTRRVKSHLGTEGHIADAAIAGDTSPIHTPDFGTITHKIHNQPEAIDFDKFQTISNIEKLNEVLSIAKDNGFLVIDTETCGLDCISGELAGICFGLGENQSYYMPLNHKDPIFSAREPGQLDLDIAIKTIKPILCDPSVLKIGHNLKYDLSVLAQHNLEITPIEDTMMLSFALDAGKNGHGMDELSILHLGHRAIAFKDVCGTGKSQITFDKVAINDATKYAAEDAEITYRLWKHLKPRLAHDRVTTIYETIERPLIAPIATMEQHGIKVDVQELNALSHDFGMRMAQFETSAHDMAGEKFNIASPKQIGEIFFDKMGLSGGKKTASGQWQVDVDVMEDLANKGHDLARTILDYRTLAKLKSTYTDNLKAAINSRTGRVHTSFNMVGALTGRLSSTDPNLQNIPIRTLEGRKIRHCFIAEAGNVLISADYSQIELRLLAHVGQIEQLQNAFKENLDIHAMTASEMFNVPLDEMTADVRRRAKAINFGIIYGISAFGLARQLGITNSEAKSYIDTYFARFPGIRAYMDSMKEFAKENKYVQTIFGRKIHLPSIDAKSGAERSFAERQAINAPLQGAAADIIKRAMARVPVALAEAGLDVKMCLQVHDELVFECAANIAERAIPIIKATMENATMPALQLSVPLIVEANAAKNWGEAH
jgi:DNA polymerase I